MCIRDRYNREGKKLYDPIFDNVDPLNFSPLYCTEIAGKFGFLDESGKEIYPVEIDEIDFENYSPLRMFKKDDKYGFFDENGETIFKPTFNEIKRVWTETIIVKKDKKWGAIDLDGKFKLETQFDNLTYNTTYNSFKALEGEKEYFFDDKGIRIKNPIFDIVE